MLIAVKLCPKRPPPWEQNGMIVLPEQSYSSRNEAMGMGRDMVYICFFHCYPLLFGDEGVRIDSEHEWEERVDKILFICNLHIRKILTEAGHNCVDGFSI